MASSILWQNEDHSVILIDIPRSIEQAQGDTSPRHLLSSPPLTSPFPSPEPKSGQARARLEQKLTDGDRHGEYGRAIEAALGDIHEHHSGIWCHPRPFTDAQPAKKRKLSEVQNSHGEGQSGVLPEDLILNLARAGGQSAYSLSDEHGQVLKDSRTFSNTAKVSTTVKLKISTQVDGSPLQFRIPPHASFYLGDCANPKPFRDAVRAEAQLANRQPDFHFVLLDPPWPNSSVKRTHKPPGSTYNTSESMQDLRDMILDTKIDFLMANECVVGVWTTNSPVSRNVVLDEDSGLFTCWDIELVEEWLWVKVTVDGESVFPVNALWRKPYEVLLIGKKRTKTPPDHDRNHNVTSIKRRVLVSVPEIHSRKPCLHELLPNLQPDPLRRRTLEVFARHLVKGWWSWGNECIKYNGEGCWQDVMDQD